MPTLSHKVRRSLGMAMGSDTRAEELCCAVESGGSSEIADSTILGNNTGDTAAAIALTAAASLADLKARATALAVLSNRNWNQVLAAVDGVLDAGQGEE